MSPGDGVDNDCDGMIDNAPAAGDLIMTLQIAIWDTSGTDLDSLVVLDNFKWSAQASDPGTVIQ